jgi:hypothetical protein
VAAHLLSRAFISVPGVNVWGEVREALQVLGAREVVIAFDADQATNRDVAKAKNDLVADLVPDFRVFDSRWDGRIGKGIDNLLVAVKKDHEIDELEFISGEIAVHVRKTVTTTTEVSVASPSGSVGSVRDSRPGFLERIIQLLLG